MAPDSREKWGVSVLQMGDVEMVDASAEEFQLKTVQDVERLFLQLTMISSNRGLQTFTDTRLLPLLRTATPGVSFMTNLNELLGHYNKRVKGNTEIRLPTAQLTAFITESNVPLQIRLCIIYLRWAVDRDTPSERIRFLPDLVRAARSKSTMKEEQRSIFALTVPALNALAPIDRKDWPADLIPLLSGDDLFLGDVRRWMASALTFAAFPREQLEALAREVENGNSLAEFGRTIFGLSNREWLIFTRQVALGQEEHFKMLKRSLVRVLEKGLLPEWASFPLLVVAAASPLTDVNDLAEGALKKVNLDSCLSSTAVICELFRLFLGSSSFVKGESPDEAVSEAPAPTRLRILSFLRRSDVAVKYFTDLINIKVARNAFKTAGFAKLQVSGLQFLLSIVGHLLLGQPSKLAAALAPALFREIRGVLEASAVQPEARGLLFACLGRLGRLRPSIVLGDCDFVRQCFDCVVEEAEETGASQSAVDCLVEWLPLFQGADPTQRALLHAIVARFISHEQSRVRMVALKYIEHLLSPQGTDLHWMLVRATADKREEMTREAFRLLQVALHKDKCPTATKLLEDLFERWNTTMTSVRPGEQQSDTEVKEARRTISVTYAMLLWAAAEVEVEGVHASFFATRENTKNADEDGQWTSLYPKVIASVFRPMATATAQKAVDSFLHAATNSIDGSVMRVTRCVMAAFPLKSFPSIYANTAASTCARMLACSTQMSIAADSGDLASALIDNIDERFVQAEKSLIPDFKSKGFVGGLEWLASSLITNPPVSDALSEELKEKRLPHSPSTLNGRLSLLAAKIVSRMEECVVEGYERGGAPVEAILGSLSRVFGRLGDAVPVDASQMKNIRELCEKIATTRKEGYSLGAREAAALILGFLPACGKEEEREEARNECLRSLFAVGEGPPRPELQFAVGEAMVHLCMDSLSPARRNPYIESESTWRDNRLSSPHWPTIYRRIQVVLDTIMDEKAHSANHHLRRAAVIWLLVVTQKSIEATPRTLDSSQLQKLQTAFVDGLSENDDFAQDMASKGIGIVYGLAGADVRKLLVEELMVAFSEGKTAARVVQGETPVFEAGQLGKTPDGEGLSTYKELCSLATEMNNPDLLYKFMQLAKHNAAWNAKKGAAFGFSVVFEQAKTELEPFVGQLVPKLYRYRYDPDPKVQASMKAIWQVLTSYRKGVVDEFADPIAREIIPALTHREWRVRESSCLAYADLLSGHSTPAILAELPKTLKTVFRVQDDVKESVRLAADRAASAIERACLREASSSNPQRSLSLLTPLLPVLVDGAAHAPIPQNKKFCLLLLVELSKESGRQLQQFIPIVIPCLLDAISDLEPSVLNYIAARANNSNLETLDDARSRAAGASPLMQAVHNLLPHLQKEQLTDLLPHLVGQLRSSVGLSTRTAASQLVTHLCLQAPQLLFDCSSACDKLFTTLRSSALRDRNPSVRKQFSSTLSYLAKFVSANQVGRLMSEAKEELHGSEEDRKSAVRHLLRALSTNASEIVSGHSAILVPYVLLEKCQEPVKGDEESKARHDAWEELWGELVPSTESAVRLYGKEIRETALSILQENQVWAVKAQAAKMIEVATDVPDQLAPDASRSLMVSLLSLLNGRYWTGKERIVHAISSLLANYGQQLSSAMSEAELNEVHLVLKREAGKKKRVQALAALKALAHLAAGTRRAEAGEDVLAILKNAIGKETSSGDGGDVEMESENEEDEGLTKSEVEAGRQKRLGEMASCLGVAMRGWREADDLGPSLAFASSSLSTPSLFYRVKQAIAQTLEDFFDKVSFSGTLSTGDVSLSLAAFAEEMASGHKRTAAVQALAVIGRLAQLVDQGNIIIDQKDLLVQRLESFEGGLPKEIGLLEKLC